MFSTFALRLKVCRLVLSISIKDLAEQMNKSSLINVNVRMIQTWEKDIDPTKIRLVEALDRVVEVFNNLGLQELSYEWLVFGTGTPPFPVDMSTAIEEEKAFYISRCLGDEYQQININSTYGIPYVHPGDQIIIKTYSGPEKLQDQISFVKTKDHRLYVGLLSNDTPEKVNIRNDEAKTLIDKTDIEICGKVHWIS